MSDKLKVVGAKALDNTFRPRLVVTPAVDGPPPTIPDPSWDDDGLELLDVTETISTLACINYPNEMDKIDSQEAAFEDQEKRRG